VRPIIQRKGSLTGRTQPFPLPNLTQYAKRKRLALVQREEASQQQQQLLMIEVYIRRELPQDESSRECDFTGRTGGGEESNE